jgi:hypothetical protein
MAFFLQDEAKLTAVLQKATISEASNITSSLRLRLNTKVPDPILLIGLVDGQQMMHELLWASNFGAI